MHFRRSTRNALLIAATTLAMVSLSAQQPAPGRGATAQSDTLVRQVRTALGHANLTEARRLVAGATAPKNSADLATALVDIYEGKDDHARELLTPIAQANPLGDAAVELGLLEVRRGQRDEGKRRLDRIASNRNLAAPDDYFRLARAARGRLEIQLADDAFQRIENAGRADIDTEYGDMMLQRHRPADAVELYGKALKADAAWVMAQIGLARAYADDDPVSSKAAFEAAKKLAPESPDVWLLTAERAIDDEESAAAGEALDRVAKVRPDSMDEAVMRVTLAFEKNDGSIDAAIARVHDIDPRSAAGYRAAAGAAAQKYRFEDAAATVRKGLAIDPDDGDALSELGMYLLRTGDEKEARTVLERSWQLNKSIRLTKNMLDLLDKLDTYEVESDGPITYKFDKGEAGALRPYALPLGREAYETFQKRYGFTPQGPILVEIFPEHDDFAVRTLGLPGIAGALGACFGRVVSMDSPEARHTTGEFSWHAVEWHELAHVFTLQLSNYKVPRWLTEGISVFEEYRRNPAWGRELTLEFAAELGEGHTFGFKGITQAFKHPSNLSLAYFEASVIVEHLVELKGDEGLRTLLKAYADGASDADAFTKAFGKSLDDVDVSYKAFVEAHYGKLRDAMGKPPREVRPDDVPGLGARAAAAPGNFVSQLYYGQALFKAGDFDGAIAPLQKASELAPMASGDASPRALLAEIYEKRGDRDRARKELRTLLASDHANVNAARQLVELASTAGATDDEDYALRVVADLDPFESATHSKLGKRLLAKNDNASALIEFQAALATKPANEADAHADVAEAYLKLGRKEEAKRQALESLKRAPTFARAQDLLLAAMGRN